MSQQGLGIVDLGVAIVEMGDLEFIQGKVIAGDYFQVSGDINAINDTIEFIVPDLKTAFLISAKIVTTTHPSLAVTGSGASSTQQKNAVQAQLKIDSVIKDTTNIGTQSMSDTLNGVNNSIIRIASGNGSLSDGKFDVLGLSLVGDGIKVIEIENTLDDGSAFATMSGYVIDT